MIKNIVFDWSGTLSNDLLQVHKTVSKVYAQFGVEPVSLDEFRESYRLPYMDHARFFGIKASKEEIDAVFSRYFREAGFPQPIDGAEKALQLLKSRGKSMIVLSSHNQLFLEEEASRFFPGATYFEHLFGDVQDKVRGIVTILKSVSFEPNETVMVGDTEHDLNAGKSAGLTTVAVLSGYRSRKHLELAKPDFIIKDVSELPSLPIF